MPRPLSTSPIASALSLALAGALAACGGDTPPIPKQLPVDYSDSIRIRASKEFEKRPDTLGSRVDKVRIAGADTATVWVVMISEFQCEACRDFARDVLPALRRAYVDSGRVRLAFVNFPQEIHLNSRFASHAALCAGASGKFWEMHDSLFATWERWDRVPDPQPYFDSLAVRAGAPRAAQAQCTQQYKLLHLLSGDIQRSRKANVRELPTVIVAERPYAGPQLRESILRAAIDSALVAPTRVAAPPSPAAKTKRGA